MSNIVNCYKSVMNTSSTVVDAYVIEIHNEAATFVKIDNLEVKSDVVFEYRHMETWWCRSCSAQVRLMQVLYPDPAGMVQTCDEHPQHLFHLINHLNEVIFIVSVSKQTSGQLELSYPYVNQYCTLPPFLMTYEDHYKDYDLIEEMVYQYNTLTNMIWYRHKKHIPIQWFHIDHQQQKQQYSFYDSHYDNNNNNMDEQYDDV